MDAPHATRVHNECSSDDDTDAVFAELEQEEPDTTYRRHRIEQLHAEFKSSSDAQRDTTQDHDNTTTSPYPTITSDKALLDLTTSTTRCIIHFAHPDFSRCQIMDAHLHSLATRHHEVRFARVDVRHTPFVVEKLNVRVLPCVIGFKDGVAVERVIGFEGLGKGKGRGTGSAGGGGGLSGPSGIDGFSTKKLERRLLAKGVLVKARVADEDGTYPDEESEDEEEDDIEDVRDRRRNGGGGGIRNGIVGRRRGGRNEADGIDDDDDDWD